MSTITPIIAVSAVVLTENSITASLDFAESVVVGNTIFTYLGSVPTLEDLPENPNNGDTYMVESENSNYAWMGEAWVDIGGNTIYEQLTEEEKSELIGLLN